MNADIDSIANIFKEYNFEVQKTSFADMLESSQLSPLKGKVLPVNDASKLLQYFPHLFMVHRTLEPKKAALFIVVTDSELSADQMKIYKNYYPNELAVVTLDSKKNIYCRWFHDKTAKPLRVFLKDSLGI